MRWLYFAQPVCEWNIDPDLAWSSIDYTQFLNMKRSDYTTHSRIIPTQYGSRLENTVVLETQFLA